MVFQLHPQTYALILYVAFDEVVRASGRRIVLFTLQVAVNEVIREDAPAA